MKKRAPLIFTACAAALALALLIGNECLTVTRLSVADARIPKSFDGFIIAQVSDLHCKEFGKDNERLFRRIEKSAPDVIAVTGDIIDRHRLESDDGAIEKAAAFVKNAAKTAPVYYVSGNHEAWSNRYGEITAALENAGAVILDDAAASIERNGEALTLAGLSLYTCESSLLAETASELCRGAYSVLLAHRPELFETYARCGADLVLSGHTHGGQVRLPFVGGLFAPNQGLFPKYDAGAFKSGDSVLYVSRGLGNSIAPLRVFDAPELVIITLKSKNAA